MAWRLKDIPRLLISPNRGSTIHRIIHAMTWQPLQPIARLQRNTLARSCQIIAVVGSTGKTTATRAIEAVLGLPHPGQANANYGLHLVRGILSLGPGEKAAVMEAGISRPGQMARYAAMLRPDIVVVTNIGSDHSPSFNGLEGVWREKSAMVRALRAGGMVMLNGDDEKVRSMAGLSDADTVFYGFGKENQIRAEDAKLDWPHGVEFTLKTPGISERIRLPLWGRHFILGALAACAVGLHLGKDAGAIKQALQSLSPVKKRMYPISLGNDIRLIEDHQKNTLETIEVALDFLAEAPVRRKLLVLGGVETPVGSTNAIARYVGELAGKSADFLFYLGPKFRRVRNGTKKTGMPGQHVMDCRYSVHTAAEELKQRLRPGDLVLIKGRNTQQLHRITMMLQGQKVGCRVELCEWGSINCASCPLLNKRLRTPG
jgi:UDP-N-acetylmuramoyl-tripeptide--D-alanyl-D-alanine ligase